MEIDVEKMQQSLHVLNESFESMGLPKLALVTPESCVPQEVNARFMDQQMMQRLVDNIQKDGRLESTPLVCEHTDPGKFWIISGHHRIEAATKAHLKYIIVMVITVKDMDELRAKQLSHNSIEGEDDDVILAKMYENLKDLQAKVYSGLQDKLQPVSVLSLSFKAGSFESFTVAFLPTEIASFDAAIDLVKNIPVTSSSIVRVAELDVYDEFAKAIRQVKKVENIKASGTALTRLIQLALERVEQIKLERPDDETTKATKAKKKAKVETAE